MKRYASFGKYSALLLIIILMMLFTTNLSADGITIIKQNKQTLLLVNQKKMPDEGWIELNLSGSGIIKLKEENKTAELRFSAGNKPVKIQLHQSLTGQKPQKIILTGTDKNFDLFSAKIKTAEGRPAEADIGQIIFSAFDRTKNGGWNVYKWNLIPEVLIFDTADYEIQARLFKRLAFFVEKTGYVGKLVTNTDLEGKHGWNAHDYKAEDLAAFFTKADETAFQLNPDEYELKSLLLDAGIILASDGKYSAGRGAVLSVSRQTKPNWRYRFLTHECLHAIFFTNNDFKDEIYGIFAGLEPEEVDFWKHLLDYRQYDVENYYLLVNEFMAYSLQQPVEEIDEYFKGFLYKRMIAARPWEKPFVEAFDADFPESFTKTVKKLEAVLYEHTGRIAGHLANLYPIEIKGNFFDLFPTINNKI